MNPKCKLLALSGRAVLTRQQFPFWLRSSSIFVPLHQILRSLIACVGTVCHGNILTYKWFFA